MNVWQLEERGERSREHVEMRQRVAGMGPRGRDLADATRAARAQAQRLREERDRLLRTGEEARDDEQVELPDDYADRLEALNDAIRAADFAVEQAQAQERAHSQVRAEREQEVVAFQQGHAAQLLAEVLPACVEEEEALREAAEALSARRQAYAAVAVRELQPLLVANGERGGIRMSDPIDTQLRWLLEGCPLLPNSALHAGSTGMLGPLLIPAAVLKRLEEPEQPARRDTRPSAAPTPGEQARMAWDREAREAERARHDALVEDVAEAILRSGPSRGDGAD